MQKEAQKNCRNLSQKKMKQYGKTIAKKKYDIGMKDE